MDTTDKVTEEVAEKSTKEKTNSDKTISGSQKKDKKKVEEYHVDPEKILKYTRDKRVKTKRVKDRRLKSTLKQKEENYSQAVKQAAKSEYLLTEESGFLEVEGTEKTHIISQRALKESVDITSAQKYFNLHLKEYGGYKINYTRNGKFLLMSGQNSHIATVNWNNKDLGCEVQSQESNRDSCWLHQDRFFAVAQKKYVHIYDNNGTEIHVLKDHKNVRRVHFLPYHFLLATVGHSNHLQYQDTSTGKSIAKLRIPFGRCDCLTSNPYNAVVQLGHPNGVVSMWSPTVQEPLVKMLCHTGPVLAIATENQGVYMATTGQDGLMKVWDIRAYKPVYKYRIQGKAAHCLAVSQRGLLAAAFGPKVYVFKDAFQTKQKLPYMQHCLKGKADITDIEFCPYEDVLGVGHTNGFTSLLIPGAGEPNFDGLEVNPYESRKQKAESEVKMLLEKIQPELITLDPTDIRKIDEADTNTKQKEKDEDMEEETFEPKYKTKGRSSSAKVLQRKRGVDEQSKREQLKAEIREKKLKEKIENKEERVTFLEKVDTSRAALDRFQKKKKKD